MCNSGYVSPVTDPGTCVPAPAPPPPLPTAEVEAGASPAPPPPPPASVTQGVLFSQNTPVTSRLNRWSRYLSCEFLGVIVVPTWSISSASPLMAPLDIFLGNDPSSAGTRRRLQWNATRDQGSCSSCWATAPTDAVAAAQAMATASAVNDTQVPVLSELQVRQCSANGTSGGCNGNVPTTALEYAALSSISSTFEAGKCAIAAAPPPSIIMYEKVQFRGWFGLLLTLQKQPAVVILEAGDSFQQASCVNKKFIFKDDDCYSGNLNHAVVVVGYDISWGYWVIRNSWGDSWCNNGYMRLGIKGGPGVCGMNVLPAYYPVPAPPDTDPCYTTSFKDVLNKAAMNPCGGGTCQPATAWGKYSYTCACPDGFVAVNNTVRTTLPGAGQGITQTCAPVDACGLALTNPCTVGTCVNDGMGSYTCLCPIGYSSDTTADGQSTCSAPGSPPWTVTVSPGIAWCQLSSAYNISRQQLQTQNPSLDLSSLTAGQVVNVTNDAFSCAVVYTAMEGDTYETIADTMQPLAPSPTGPQPISAADLKALNPYAYSCSAAGRMRKGQVICLRAGARQDAPTCNKLYTMRFGETCSTVTDTYFPNDPIPFYAMNPGLDCGLVSSLAATAGMGAAGVTVCVGSEPVGARKCPSITTLKGATVQLKNYIGTKGDTCFTIRNSNANCKQFNDKTLYKASEFRTRNPVLDCSKVTGYQFCCPP